jgi:hypothetical protein
MVCRLFSFNFGGMTRKQGPKVDKYGRPVSASKQGDNLKRYYRLEESSNPDLARGEVVLQSSDEDDTSDEDVYPDPDLQHEEHPAESTHTSRLAIVNLDWDHVRAHHLYKICSSLGHVQSVRVYPSEFGKGRMAREEKEGPPIEIFKKNQTEEEEVNEKTVYDVGEGECDLDALRTYQLERLRYVLFFFSGFFSIWNRYYYAIVDCDTVQTATHIYNELDGTELERSANVFDLSFVPEDMTFDGEPRSVFHSFRPTY